MIYLTSELIITSEYVRRGPDCTDAELGSQEKAPDAYCLGKQQLNNLQREHGSIKISCLTRVVRNQGNHFDIFKRERARNL